MTIRTLTCKVWTDAALEALPQGRGTRLVWLVYPRNKSVEVYTVPGTMTLLACGKLDGGDVLPGFRLALDEIFAEWF